MTDILLSCWIPGRPRPQGALKTFAVAGKATAGTRIPHSPTARTSSPPLPRTGSGSR